jgi:hypothetical protein
MAAPPSNTSVPTLTVVNPVYVFAPPNVTSPAPIFVNVFAPPPITPVNRTSLAAVSESAEVNVPAPVNVSTPLFTASPSVTPPPNDTAFDIVRAVIPSLERIPPLTTKVPAPNAASFPTHTLPAETVVPPPYVFAPLNVNTPVPSFVNANAPLTVLLNTNPLPTVNVVAPVSAVSPENVNVPLFAESPNVIAPDKLNAFPKLRAVVPSLETLPPVTETVPVPNA